MPSGLIIRLFGMPCAFYCLKIIARSRSSIKGLAGHGFGVDAFSSAGDGLDAFRSVSYDAIILDLGLPDRNGLDVLRESRGRGSVRSVNCYHRA